MAAFCQLIGHAARSAAWRRAPLWVTAIGAAAVSTGGCRSGSAETSIGPAQVKCQVALASAASSIGPDGGPGTVTVTTSPECAWDVSAGVSWLSGLSPTAGQGNGTVQFHAAPNPLPAAREGDIVVNDAHLRVFQLAARCRFDVQPSDLAADAGGGTHQVAVSAASGCAWTAATDAGWITFTTPVSGNGGGTVGVGIAPNLGSGPRVGTIVLADQRITVAQASVAGTAPCAYTLSLSGDVAIAAPGGSGVVAVSTTAGCPWTASSSVPWVTVTSAASGSGSGAVAFSVATNPGSARVGTVTIAGQTFTVTQASATIPCAYSIAPPDASIPAGGGSGTVSVTAGTGCNWATTSNAAWLTVTSGASGTGNGSVAFTVAANPGPARTGTIAIAGQTFAVNQAAAPACTYSLNPTSASIAALGGTGNVAISAGAGCDWTASSNAGWITVTSGSSGTGNGSVAFAVAPNISAARSATVTIAGQTFTVDQAALICTYAINPTSATVPRPE
jgi:hypothetical protein